MSYLHDLTMDTHGYPAKPTRVYRYKARQREREPEESGYPSERGLDMILANRRVRAGARRREEAA